MWNSPHPTGEEVDQLLVNAQLRDALEPFFDEALSLIDNRRMPTSAENEFLAQMLAWECAPVLPVSKWFEPELVLPPPDSLDDAALHAALHAAIARLYDARIVLDYTEHLSDRQLYCLLCRDILPAPQKKIDASRNFLHWSCLDIDEEPETWLRYYATEDERSLWQEETGELLPTAEAPPFPRTIPCEPEE
jgi:hypothetical protein